MIASINSDYSLYVDTASFVSDIAIYWPTERIYSR